MIFTRLKYLFFAVTFLGVIGGCLSPNQAEREADETARKLASSVWKERFGATNSFERLQAAEAFTFRLALEAVRQGVTNAVFPSFSPSTSAQGGTAPLAADSNGLIRISLNEALRLGARHNRKYRTLKETVYLKALSMDTEHYAFDTTFSGMVLGALAGNPEVTKESAGAGGDTHLVQRKFEQGAVVAGNMAVDVAKMIRDDWHSFAWTGDLTMNVPLMRGAGRDIVREPLTQAERNLAYALLTFARYRQTYALSVAKAYFSVLEYAQSNRNSADNANRLQQNYARAEMMFRAGRMTRIEFDQAKTDLLTARQSTITTRQSYEDALDDFKITLGLPPESPIALRDSELTILEEQMKAQAASANANATARERDLFAAAEGGRFDLVKTQGEYEDAKRKVRVAADALRADLTVEGGSSYKGTRRQHADTDDETTTAAKLKFSMPWDRRVERNDYLKAIVTRDQAKRSLEESADTIKNEIRAALRDLEAKRVLYVNKVETWKTACLRVQANDLFTQSGRSSMRDILEAESALLSARNALCSAVIGWWTSELTLKCAAGILDVSDEGTWK